MKRILTFLAIFLGFLAVSCYDDTALTNQLNDLKDDYTELSDEIDALKAILDASETGAVIVSVKEVADGYEIKLSSGETLVIKHGKDGQDGQDGQGGSDGSSPFADILVTDDAVTFVLTDGQEVVIPIVRPLDVTFSVADENVYIQTEQLVFTYTIVGGTEKNKITVLSDDIDAEVVPTDAYTGYIVANTDEQSADVTLVVLVTDGVSNTIFKTVSYYSGVFNTVPGIEVPAEGGLYEIPVITNMNFVPVISDDCDWLSLPAETKAIEVREDFFLLEVAPNTTEAARSTIILIAIEGAQYIWQLDVPVTQLAASTGEPQEPVELTAEFIAGTYYGEVVDAYNYYVVFSTNAPDASGYYPYNTKFFAVDLYSSVAPSGETIIVPAGEYNYDVDDTCLAGTFSDEYSYSLIIDENGGEKEFEYIAGNVVVSADKVELNLTLTNGEVYNIVYNGVPDITPSESGGNGVSTLTDDLDISSTNGYAQAVCYGDYDGLYDFMISIYADATTFSGHGIMFEILSDHTGITGEYTPLDYTASSLTVGFLPGEYDTEDGYLYPYCSWYMSVTEGGMDGLAYAPIIDGKLTITEENGVYTYTIDTYDDNGNNITGVIQAQTDIFDAEGNPMNAQRKRAASPKTMTLKNNLKIKKPLHMK